MCQGNLRHGGRPFLNCPSRLSTPRKRSQLSGRLARSQVWRNAREGVAAVSWLPAPVRPSRHKDCRRRFRRLPRVQPTTYGPSSDGSLEGGMRAGPVDCSPHLPEHVKNWRSEIRHASNRLSDRGSESLFLGVLQGVPSENRGRAAQSALRGCDSRTPDIHLNEFVRFWASGGRFDGEAQAQV